MAYGKIHTLINYGDRVSLFDTCYCTTTGTSNPGPERRQALLSVRTCLVCLPDSNGNTTHEIKHAAQQITILDDTLDLLTFAIVAFNKGTATPHYALVTKKVKICH